MILEEFYQKSLIENFIHKNNVIKKPSWLKTPFKAGKGFHAIKTTLRQNKLHTVCEEAHCPNIGECLNCGTATFMILGDTCTRNCRFCNVNTGNPHGILDPQEPLHLAQAIEEMKLSYAVITMVDRDDLEDGGAFHISQTLLKIKEINPQIYIEILTGDFQNKDSSLNILQEPIPFDVWAHNIETVESQTKKSRDAKASYKQSLEVLQKIKKVRPKIYTKSGLILGIGEHPREISESLKHLREVGVEILTLGQYLQPTPKHLPVSRFVTPEEFHYWKEEALAMGFLGVASGPLVRSSYRAQELFP